MLGYRAESLSSLATKERRAYRPGRPPGCCSEIATRRTLRFAVALALLSAGCAVAPSSNGPVGGSPSAAQSAPITSPVAGIAVTGLLDIAGPSIWEVGSSGVASSANSGATWTETPLPTGVTASDVLAITGAAQRGMWLATGSGTEIGLYHLGPSSSTWSDTVLATRWPSGVETSGASEAVLMNAGGGHLLSVVVNLRIGTFAGLTSSFVSNDDGLTFVHPEVAFNGRANEVLWAQSFSSPTRGVAVGGPTREDLLQTSDGGRSWAVVQVAGEDDPGSYAFGDPIVNGADLEVPLTTERSDGGEDVAMVESLAGGAGFSITGSAIAVGTGYHPPVISSSIGETTWVMADDGQRIFETVDSGSTWRTVAAAGLGPDVVSIHVSSPTSAIALLVASACTALKTGCTSNESLVATSDSGATWGPPG